MKDSQVFASMLETLVLLEAPQLAERLVVTAEHREKLFDARPFRCGVALNFGTQAVGHPDLMGVIREAVVASEALLYGITTAAAIRLDAMERWAWAQRQQGSD